MSKEYDDYLAQNAPDELAAWFDAEHVETKKRALDGDTDAQERKSADLIYEYYKPMVSELQAKIAALEKKLRISWEYECRFQDERDNLAADLLKANNERERYREKFGKCIDHADAIHALMDEGMA